MSTEIASAFEAERMNIAVRGTRDAVTLIADTHVPAAAYDQAAPFRRLGARPPDLADRRDQRLEPDRRRDPQDRRRLPALSRLEPRAQCVRRRRVGICLCAGG